MSDRPANLLSSATVHKWRLRNGEYVPIIINNDGEEQEVVWAPQKGSQAAFLESTETEVLFAGTRAGCGKTDALLMSYAMDVGCGWGPSLKGIIVRQSHPMLKEVIAKSKRWFPRLFPGSFYNEIKFRWEFPDGETLVFDHLMDETDFRRYLGQEYTFIGFEELITWQNLKPYGLMFSCLRSSIPGIPRKIRATTNPYGPSHNEIMQRFRINERKEGQILGPLIEGEKDEEGHKLPSRRVIFGHIFENKLLMKVDPDYMDRMLAGAPSEALQKAWRDGDWNITAGGMFGDIWATHADYIQVSPFEVPENWVITRAYDHGSQKPACCLWFAKSNGENLSFPDGSIMFTKRGDLFLVGELYIASSKHEGLNLDPHEIIKRIIKYEITAGWRDANAKTCRVRRGPADTGIWAETDGRPSIANDMEQHVMVDNVRFRGIIWEQADKIKGSRKQGWEQMRKRLHGTKPIEGYREFPGLFVCTNCVNWIRTVPWLQRDEKDMDDVPENAEDHCAEATRFRLRYYEPAGSLTRRVGAVAGPTPDYGNAAAQEAQKLNQAGYGRGAPPAGGVRTA